MMRILTFIEIINLTQSTSKEIRERNDLKIGVEVANIAIICGYLKCIPRK